MMNKFTCLSCGGENFTELYNFGNIPLVNSFNYSFEISNVRYPLSVVICKNCLVCQLKEVPPPEKIFTEYGHFSSASKDNILHLKSFSSLINNLFMKSSRVLEVGCNDGTLLELLDNLGFIVLGIDPAKNMNTLPIHKKLNTTFQSFGLSSVDLLLKKNNQEKFDCIFGLNVFAHFSNVMESFIAIKKLLKNDGYFIFEVAYAFDTIFSGIYDTVYHEHVFNHSVVGLKNMLNAADLKILGINKLNTQGGSIRVFVGKKHFNKDISIQNNVFPELLNFEINKGIQGNLFIKNISRKITHSIDSIKNLTRTFIENKNEQCFLLGAPARGVVIANTCGFDFFQNLIVIDDTEDKNNKFFPGLNVKVNSWDQIKYYSNVKKAILLSWNYKETMLKKLKNKGFKGKVLCYFPEPEIINI